MNYDWDERTMPKVIGKFVTDATQFLLTFAYGYLGLKIHASFQLSKEVRNASYKISQQIATLFPEVSVY
jgi:hypothetical protein